jgi:HPt (histidine-containing phosphotransfer) domain-containing protein
MMATTLDVLALHELRERTGHDEALLCELLDDFLAHVATRELGAAVEAQAFGTANALAHRMKGSLLTLGAKAAARSAGEVEEQAEALAVATAPDASALHALAIAMADLTERLADALDAMRAVSQCGAASVALSVSSR